MQCILVIRNMLQLDQTVLYIVIKSMCYSLSFCVGIPCMSCPYNKDLIYTFLIYGQMHGRCPV